MPSDTVMMYYGKRRNGQCAHAKNTHYVFRINNKDNDSDKKKSKKEEIMSESKLCVIYEPYSFGVRNKRRALA